MRPFKFILPLIIFLSLVSSSLVDARPGGGNVSVSSRSGSSRGVSSSSRSSSSGSRSSSSSSHSTSAKTSSSSSGSRTYFRTSGTYSSRTITHTGGSYESDLPSGYTRTRYPGDGGTTYFIYNDNSDYEYINDEPSIPVPDCRSTAPGHEYYCQHKTDNTVLIVLAVIMVVIALSLLFMIISVWVGGY